MIFPRPTAAEERWLELARRYPALRAAAEARAGGWKSPSLLSRALMFVLGLLAASMLAGSLVWFPGRLLFAGAAMIVGAEWLVRSRRLVAGGVEEALLACGAGTATVECLSWAEPVNGTLAILALSAALLAAGLRLGNALFTTAAALGASFALASIGTSSLFGSPQHEGFASLWCAGLAVAALALGSRQWRRPSGDRLLDGLVIAMPVAAFGWALGVVREPLTLSRLAAAGVPATLPAALAAAFATAWLFVGLRRRSHPPLVGGLLSVVCLAWALRDLTGMPLHGRLMLWGSLAFAAGLSVERWLRTPRDGLTSAPLGGRSSAADLLQIVGAAHLSPPPAAAPETYAGGGGGFGGGGASGRF